MIMDYINQQPGVVSATIAGARSFRAAWRPSGGGLRLVGSGSSRNALIAATPALARAGLGPVTFHGPAEFLVDLAAGVVANGDVLVLSQSGASVTSIAAAKAAVAAGLQVVAITAETEAPIARTGAEMLALPIGVERIGPKTKGFAASLAALLVLAQADGDPGPALVQLLAEARLQAEALLAAASAADCILIAGSGALLGIALEASLKIAEIAGLPTAAYPWEEVLHGRLHGLTERSLCLVLTDDAQTHAEALQAQAAMSRRGASIEIMDFVGLLPKLWTPLAALLPFQWLAVLLAQARGMQPELMRYPGLSADLAIKASVPT
jgi:fructoselysine-6-P-deglycase FrlB-like protein